MHCIRQTYFSCIKHVFKGTWCLSGDAGCKSNYIQIVQELIACVLSLRPRYLLALKRATNESQGRGVDDGIPPEECISAFNGSQISVEERTAVYDDDDTVKCIVRLFLSACEAFSTLIASCNDQAWLPYDCQAMSCAYLLSSVCWLSRTLSKMYWGLGQSACVCLGYPMLCHVCSGNRATRVTSVVCSTEARGRAGLFITQGFVHFLKGMIILQALELLEFLVHICMHPSLDLFKMSVWTVGKVAVSVREWRGMQGYPAAVEPQIRTAYEKFVAILSSRCRWATILHCCLESLTSCCSMQHGQSELSENRGEKALLGRMHAICPLEMGHCNVPCQFYTSF
jgi:hypothetical protein